MTQCLRTWSTKGLGTNNLRHRCHYKMGHGGPCLCRCEQPGLFTQVISFRTLRRTPDAQSDTYLQTSTGRT